MLRGGSSGQQTDENENGTNFGSFTRTGVKTVYASPKKPLDVRILPAFDESMSLTDEGFNLGVQGYRSTELGLDDDTGTEAFTSWFWPIEGYTYMGLGKKQFISPLTGVPFYPAGHDPIRDAYVYIDKYVSDPAIKALALGKTVTDHTGKESKLQGYLSKTPRRFGMMNVLVEGDTRGSWTNAVLIVPQTTLRDLKEQLSIITKRSDKVVITPEWEDYYYGDITHPKHGCIARVQAKNISIGNNSVKTSGFYLDQDPENQEAHCRQVMPITEAHIKARYRVFDTASVTNLEEKEVQYQIILDYLVEDGVVPLDVLEAACGQYGTVNRDLRRANLSWFKDEPPVGEGVAKSGGMVSSKPSQPSSSTAAATQSLAKSKEAEAPKEEAKKPEPEKEATDGGPEQDEKKARFKELQNKLAKEPLTVEELTELATLGQA